MPGYNVPVHSTFRRQILGLGKEQNLDGTATIDKMAGRDQAIAAVVALAAAHQHRPGNAERQQHLGKPPASILHENEGRDAIFFDGQAVQCPHLIACEQHRFILRSAHDR